MKITSNQTVQTLDYSKTETKSESTKPQTPETQNTVSTERSNVGLKQNAMEAKGDRNLMGGILKADLDRQAQQGPIKDLGAGLAPNLGATEIKTSEDLIGANGANTAQSPLEQYKEQAGANVGALQNGIAQGLQNIGMSPNFAKHLTGGTGQPSGTRLVGEPGTQHRPTGPDVPVEGTTEGESNSQSPNLLGDVPGFQSRENPLSQYKNASEAKSALAGNDAGVNDAGTKTSTGAAEPKQTQPKEESWFERIARQVFGPMSNENARKQDPEYQKSNGSKERPAEDQPEKGEVADYGYNKQPGQVADPWSEDSNSGYDVERLAARMAASAGAKVNPNPNDDGSTGGEVTGPVMPGVVDPPDEPINNEPSPRVVGGPVRPGGPGGIIGPHVGD